MSQSSALESPRASNGAGTSRNMLSNWARIIEIWSIRQRARQDLSELDDRLLDDVGITREDALSKGSKPFWRP